MVISKARPAGAPRTGAASAVEVELGPPRSCLVTAASEGPTRALVDLLAAGVTAVEGEPSTIEERLVEMASEAAAGCWSPPCDVVAVGLPATAAIAGVVATERPVHVLHQLTGALRPDRPVVVLVAPGRCSDRFELVALERAARSQAGVALVVGGDWPGASFVVSAVVRAGRDASARAASGRPTNVGPGPDEHVEVAILGPVEIRGAAGSFVRRPKLTELVVYLALHPAGASTASWSAALWPNRLVPDQTVANRLSEARRALGFAPDGRPRLRKQGERHQLVAVDSDWARFRALADADLGVESWRAALELVRGRPFEGLFDRQWCSMEGLLAEVELTVVDCGLRLGRELLRAGDPEGAQWAATRTLKACPFDERVHRLLMRAADASGNRAGVKQVFRQLTLMLEVDGDPRSAVHPQTAALYARLAEEPARAR